MADLLLDSYDYALPPELIAIRPLARRDNSKLLVFFQKNNEILHTTFSELPNILQKNDLIVRNQSEVFSCRIKARKKSGGSVEIFFLTPFANKSGEFRALLKSNGKKRIGDTLYAHELTFVINGRNEYGEFFLKNAQNDLSDFLKKHGLVPIPPYIRKGAADFNDEQDYQTHFAKYTGSVAAPTAGLHYTKHLDQKLLDKGIEIANVTLHVGPGTFSPVSSTHLTDHKMHTEEYFIEKKDLEKIREHRGRIIANGTTTLRVLESIYNQEILPDTIYSTNIFLHPGKDIKSVDGLITNFHLPKSTLLILVSCLIGREKTLELYSEAIKQKYRFYSYGDAMLILR
ncbi:MAG: tRNA preQ1(34) S-adenosylmethionine ribosyltransferase-isomerase QueA [Halobacteriovoraceae bacterium]|nr:tRNA preQ1(34) S-adenosylmethionine ribosyltransferase-isomerase QueA [Halobacteriovoraceae bacterium]